MGGDERCCRRRLPHCLQRWGKQEQPSQVSVNPTDQPNTPLRKTQKALKMDPTSSKSTSSPKSRSLAAETSAQPSTSRVRQKRLSSQESSQITAKKPQVAVISTLEHPDGGFGDKEKEADDAIIMEEVNTRKPESEKPKPEQGAGLSPVSVQSLEGEPLGSHDMEISATAITETGSSEIAVNREDDYGNFQWGQEMPSEQANQRCKGARTHNQQQNHSIEYINLETPVGQQVVKETSIVEMKYVFTLKEISIKLILMCNKLQKLKSSSSCIGEVDNMREINDMLSDLYDIPEMLDSCSAERDQCKTEIKRLQQENKQQKDEIHQLKKEIQQLKEAANENNTSTRNLGPMRNSSDYTTIFNME